MVITISDSPQTILHRAAQSAWSFYQVCSTLSWVDHPSLLSSSSIPRNIRNGRGDYVITLQKSSDIDGLELLCYGGSGARRGGGIAGRVAEYDEGEHLPKLMASAALQGLYKIAAKSSITAELFVNNSLEVRARDGRGDYVVTMKKSSQVDSPEYMCYGGSGICESGGLTSRFAEYDKREHPPS
jgi:hypothetical protein